MNLVAADFESAPANKRLRNATIVDYDRFWNATVDTTGIKSLALYVSGIQYLCGKFSADASLNMKIGDNVRLNINALSIVGA